MRLSSIIALPALGAKVSVMQNLLASMTSQLLLANNDQDQNADSTNQQTDQDNNNGNADQSSDQSDNGDVDND